MALPSHVGLSAPSNNLPAKRLEQEKYHHHALKNIQLQLQDKGMAFRLVGTAFVTLPALQKVIVSGYCQQLDKTTWRINDDYLFRFKGDRDGFNRSDFQVLDRLDSVAALGVYAHRRNVTATGVFKVIEPYSRV